MNKFNKIINKASQELLEYAENPVISNAVKGIQQAITRSGNSNPNAKALAAELFDTPEGSDLDPLHTAFNKIKDNPENPNLSPKELEMFLSVAEKLKPETPIEKEEDTEKTPSTYQGSTTTTTPQKSQQPNATQYNPLKQAGS
jgi:hypothetical protein